MANYMCNACDLIVPEGDIGKREERDPFATGDSWYAENVLYCTSCGSEDVEEFVGCDTCDLGKPVDGYDDCASCILLDQYCHTKLYEPVDYGNARESLTESELCMIEEQINRTLDRGRA